MRENNKGTIGVIHRKVKRTMISANRVAAKSLSGDLRFSALPHPEVQKNAREIAECDAKQDA